MKFLRPNGPPAISKPIKKTQPGNEVKGAPLTGSHLSRIDEAIVKMTNYVTRRDAQIAELKQLRDQEVDHAIAEMQSVKDVVSELREKATVTRTKAAKYEEHVAELKEQIRLLKQEADELDEAISKSGIVALELHIAELERNHATKIEAVEGEGLLRRYRRRLAQLQEKRTRLAS
jgi:chromosome segregation ATPase